ALAPYLGPARYATVQPQALLLHAGARVAYGSDWPVDPLDAWFALKVAVTRTAAPGAGKEYAGRLTAQPGTPRAAVLRAATIDAAWTLRQEESTGSLELGKLADADLQHWLEAELNKPLDPADVASAASTPEMAAEMYLASVLMVDEEHFMERAYLDELARCLQLDPQLKAELESQVRGVSA
ncbi:DUF533 domain-containing protein, partial [Stutzerimonas kunmingensis]|uniref:DUF533 domain-containing protein n=1 Tax=Stutzerimonas kunmingensis TaxID=1211807 RepID=UPI00289DA775